MGVSRVQKLPASPTGMGMRPVYSSYQMEAQEGGKGQHQGQRWAEAGECRGLSGKGKGG